MPGLTWEEEEEQEALLTQGEPTGNTTPLRGVKGKAALDLGGKLRRVSVSSGMLQRGRCPPPPRWLLCSYSGTY